MAISFMEVVDSQDKRHLINIRHIEEIAEIDDKSCYIYLAFNCPNANEQDYYLINEPYEVIKALIKAKRGAE